MRSLYYIIDIYIQITLPSKVILILESCDIRVCLLIYFKRSCYRSNMPYSNNEYICFLNIYIYIFVAHRCFIFVVHSEVYSIQHYMINICQWLSAGRWFSPGTPVSSTNKIDRHDISDILLNVTLNTNNPNP
jgi:hypothetical protein